MKTILVIIDDNLPEDFDPIIVRSEEIFDEVERFEFPSEAIQYISNNLDKYLVVLLDYKFSEDEETGTQIISNIRGISSLIPVIIWTAEIGQIDDYPELINRHAYAVHSKVKMEEIMESLIEAKNETRNSILEALEEYISKYSEGDQQSIKLESLNGKSYSLKELFSEISNRTEIGLDIEKILVKMTIKSLLEDNE
ncbi:MAG: hypothetical protein RIC19_21030 [Phaeodactylibacter sp.]|uniref:hypothetical protein n=1 Tax=Phaeodactylibacter sp. TaxID=1940289 RepID=UPI0032ED1DF6